MYSRMNDLRSDGKRNRYTKASDAGIGNTLLIGLLAFYPLTTDASDVSGNNNDGTDVGTVSYGVNGASFTSGSYINLPSLYSGSSDRSVFLKFNAPSIPSGYENTIYAAGVTESSKMFGVGITVGGDVLRFYGYANDLSYDAWDTPDYGVEHSVLLMYAGGTRSWYLDGNFINSDTPALNTSTTNHRIGSLLGDTFNGTVKDLQIWNRGITAIERAKLFN